MTEESDFRPAPALLAGETVCIVGLGLMGGSLALAWRAAGVPIRIHGVSRNPKALGAALEGGAIDAGSHDLATGVRGSTVVVLATPVRAILSLLPEVGSLAERGTVMLDLGSTKSAICRAMADLPDGLEPVGGHPMCGKETSGYVAADANLYSKKTFVLCPLPRTSEAALARARALAEAAGAVTLTADPESHDAAVAAISHLPYAAAASLVNAVAAAADPLAECLAASGFRDTTRVASSDVEMMLDVLLTNRVAVTRWLDRYGTELQSLRHDLAENDEHALRSRLAAARQHRAALNLG